MVTQERDSGEMMIELGRAGNGVHTHMQKGEQQEEKWGCTLGFYPTLSPGPTNVLLELISPLMDVCESLLSPF